jgi:hypothetical protein
MMVMRITKAREFGHHLMAINLVGFLSFMVLVLSLLLVVGLQTELMG